MLSRWNGCHGGHVVTVGRCFLGEMLCVLVSNVGGQTSGGCLYQTGQFISASYYTIPYYLTPLNPLSVRPFVRLSVRPSVRPEKSPLGPKGLCPLVELERTFYLTPLNPLSVLLSILLSVRPSVRPPDSLFGPEGPFSPPQELERSPP